MHSVMHTMNISFAFKIENFMINIYKCSFVYL